MKQVLIVDDERAFLTILSQGLQGHEQDFGIITAENGKAAVEVLRRQPVDLLVTDIKMPQMDGFELLEYMKSNHPGVPVMLMTAFGTQEMEARGRALGARQYLEKPFDVDTLVQKIRSELERELATDSGGGADGGADLKLLAWERGDDDRALHRRLQQRGGFTVTTAADVPAVLERFAVTAVDALLFPVAEREGWQLVERFTTQHHFTPVVVVARGKDCDGLRTALRAGAADFLSYDEPLDDVAAALRAAVDRSRALKRTMKSQVRVSYESEIDRMQHEMAHELNRVFSLQDEYEQNRFQMVKVLVNALQINDPYESGHSERVAIKAKNIAAAMNQAYLMAHGLFDLKELEMAALLHDVGKLGVPKHILNYKGALSDDEWTIVRRHSVLGAEIVSKIDNLRAITADIRHHHERWDGGGYPDRLAREQIPIKARILALADAFDAMVSPRVYRQALGLPDIVGEIKRNSGTQFDPEVVNGLLMLIGYD